VSTSGMKKFLRLAILPAVFVLLLPAQEPQLLHLVMTKLQPGAAGEYREMQAKVNEAYKKDSVPWRQVWSTSVFGEPQYVAVFPVGKMERYETPNPVRKMLNDTDYAHYSQQMSRLVASSRSVLVTTRPDLSIASENRKPKRAVVTVLIAEPGKQAAVEAVILSDLKPAWQKAGMKDVWVHQTILGGPVTEYTIVALIDNWAEMDSGGPMVRALGREGWDKIRQKVAGLATSIENSVMAHQPELSYMQP
jgi:hypothetical protein